MTSESSVISTSAMERIIEDLKNQRHQNSTKKVYYSVWRKFNEFVIRLDRIPARWEERVALYCAYMIQVKQLQSSTVRSYVSAIKSVLQDDGYSWDQEFMLLATLTRACKLHFDQVKNRLPIGKRLLSLLLLGLEKKFDNQPYLEIMYKTLFLLAYYGLMRVGELTLSQHVLKAKDVHEARNKNKLLLILHSSKTHGPGDRPQHIRITGLSTLEVSDDSKTKLIEYSNKECENTLFCPVTYTTKYIDMRDGREHDSEPFFQFRDGSPVKSNHMRDTLRSLLTNLGLNSDLYDTHSFRIGRATDLFKSERLPIDIIKHVGRWKSNAVYKYLRD